MHEAKSCLFLFCFTPNLYFFGLFGQLFSFGLYSIAHFCSELAWPDSIAPISLALVWPVPPLFPFLFFFWSCSCLCAFCGCCSKSVELFVRLHRLHFQLPGWVLCFCCCFGLTLSDLNTQRKASPLWNEPEEGRGGVRCAAAAAAPLTWLEVSANWNCQSNGKRNQLPVTRPPKTLKTLCPLSAPSWLYTDPTSVAFKLTMSKRIIRKKSAKHQSQWGYCIRM